MKRLIVSFVGFLVAATIGFPAGGASADGPTSDPRGGFTSKNVKWLEFVPFEVGTETGGRIIGNYFYTTSWRSFSIYDVSKPTDPQLVSQTFFGQEGDDPFEFESEDMPTNGKVLIMSETYPRNVLHVFDVKDPANPKEIADIDTTSESVQHTMYRDFGAGDDAYRAANHTMSCLYDCTWLWGSAGAIVDLRDPSHPKVMQHYWWDSLPKSLASAAANSGHDVVEVKPGYVLTATEPILYLDARDPVHPKLLAVGHAKDNRFIHSVLWPQDATDKFVLASGETNFRPACGDTNGDFQTWDASNWKKTHSFQMIDEMHVEAGTYSDGNPAVHGLGCSTHWFDPNPTFDNSGIVAEGTYENGSRFWGITPEGKIKDYGYFLPYFGSTSANYWRTNRVVYSVDYGRGFDVLKYTGPLTVS